MAYHYHLITNYVFSIHVWFWVWTSAFIKPALPPYHIDSFDCYNAVCRTKKDFLSSWQIFIFFSEIPFIIFVFPNCRFNFNAKATYTENITRSWQKLQFERQGHIHIAYNSVLTKAYWTNGWTYGRTGGWTYGRAYGRTGGRYIGRTVSTFASRGKLGLTHNLLDGGRYTREKKPKQTDRQTRRLTQRYSLLTHSEEFRGLCKHLIITICLPLFFLTVFPLEILYQVSFECFFF